MRRLLFFMLGISMLFPATAQKKTSIHSETYTQWKSKSPIGISIYYDRRKYDHDYSIQTVIGYIPAQGYPFTTDQAGELLESYSRDYKIKKNITNTIRLQVDYWLFPFLNIYVLGGKIFDESKLNAALQINYIDLPPFSQSIKTDGWIYGCGTKSEFIYHHFKPQIKYTIYWNHFDEISNKSIFQTITPKLGYIATSNKNWIKNIEIYAGATYNHIKFKNHYAAYYDEPTLQQIFAEIHPSEEGPLQPHGGILDAIILKNIHDWNMTTGIEIEFCHHIHYKFETIFLGKETTISTGITYRLFGKK